MVQSCIIRRLYCCSHAAWHEAVTSRMCKSASWIALGDSLHGLHVTDSADSADSESMTDFADVADSATDWADC